MQPITFIDTEIEPKSGKILDLGGIKDNGSTFHSTSISEFANFLKGGEFICGHNIIHHDLKYIINILEDAEVNPDNFIDTLFLSPLLFPTRPYHALLKDDKLQSDEANNPLNDSTKAKDLFYDEVTAFHQLDDSLKQIFCGLLNNTREFSSFFRFVSYTRSETDNSTLIHKTFENEICQNVDLAKIISDHAIELAYCLSLINSLVTNKHIHSITPPWVLKNYPLVEQIMLRLRNRHCIAGCPYCDSTLDIHKGLKQFFGFDSFRTYGGEALQEKAVKAAVENKSLLAIFPTGGGKSLTFQVPALLSGERARGLTVVISPLQSLMKDQIDNLEKLGITDAVTVNGLLDPIEKAKSLERVESGSASLLYISPESLRSRTIEKLLLGRNVVRFVIDEAHCFSSWGQDFRVDYLYIGDFIKSLQEQKHLDTPIPVSCFTATAKQKVIEDIRQYFRTKLSLELELFTSSASRTNLHYRVFEKADEETKYQGARDLIEAKSCPTIIYVSRTRKAYELAERLTQDGLVARPYHGKMDVQEKTANQNGFISGEIPIMVATSAFGMGVDKKDVGMVIHYDISDSLENYVQEAGRAGRDESLQADCYVLFNEEDLGKHFILLNQTKLSIKEIQQVWKAVKDITGFRSTVSNSALEIARLAGWDDNVVEIETRVTSAIAALEDAGYLKRGQNMPRVFANSILSKNAQEAIDKISSSERFGAREKEKGVRIIKKLFSSKSRKSSADDAAESRIDYLGDHLGIVREEVINIVNLLREEGILADAKDLTAFIKRGENKNRSLALVDNFSKLERFLLKKFDQEERTFHLKELNEEAEKEGCDVSPAKLKTIINYWAIKNWIRRKSPEYARNHVAVVCVLSREELAQKMEKRHQAAKFIAGLLHEKSNHTTSETQRGKEEVLVEFSVHELKTKFEQANTLFQTKISVDDMEDALFYLSRIGALKIEGGFMVVYNRLTIERIEQDNKRRYKNEDYQKLEQYYKNKIQQIHIVGEYAKKMLIDYKDALQFVEDYFQLNYTSFLNKYFKGSRQDEIKRTLTPAKFKQLFGQLSPTQLKIINDKESKYIVVAAGPGSGKTRILVHKLASLLIMEDVKHEQLLMLTFSRAAATEFKKRLLALIGNAAHFIEIKTFHSYCFDLLGRVGSLEQSNVIVRNTTAKIKNREVEVSRVTKTVLVIDEAQDMDQDEFNLVKALMDQNEEMRVIAVGDDDQNIYAFRGASSKHLQELMQFSETVKYELIENYRSKNNLVQFTNQFVNTITHRLKSAPIISQHSANGKIRLVRYNSPNLITPLVNEILSTDLTGTTAVLTRTNEEALQVTGLLLKGGMNAKLIQSNEGFGLYNLVEVRYFFDQLNLKDDTFVIDNESWATAKSRLEQTFSRSTKLDICRNIINDFAAINTKTKYKSDLKFFLHESKLEDFFNEYGEAIVVSTIHKAKGTEFDNVFLMLDNFKPSTDEATRQLYVAMTRAKQNLTIHLNSNFLNNISAENIERVDMKEAYLPPTQMVMHLSLKDVVLDYFINRQVSISRMVSGDELAVKNGEYLTSKGMPVVKFSKGYLGKIEALAKRNFRPISAKVNFVVYWLKEDTEKEILTVLPELSFTNSD